MLQPEAQASLPPPGPSSGSGKKPCGEQPVVLRASASHRLPADGRPHVLPQPAAQPAHTSLMADVLGLASETALRGFLFPYLGT